MITGTYRGDFELTFGADLQTETVGHPDGYSSASHDVIENQRLVSVEIFGTDMDKEEFVAVFGEKAWDAMEAGPDTENVDFDQ